MRTTAARVVRGTVWSVLVLAVAVAAFGGMFTPTHPAPAAAALPRSVVPDPTLTVPRHTGRGLRIVFDQSDQRVWLVGADGSVERSYLVTGSNRDNVHPGNYRVMSRVRYARTYRGGGTFEYFVRFTQGHTAPIGFHSVTVLRKNGKYVYTRSQLGTPRTPGCVEAWRNDARALWEFAPVGTKVVVTA